MAVVKDSEWYKKLPSEGWLKDLLPVAKSMKANKDEAISEG